MLFEHKGIGLGTRLKDYRNHYYHCQGVAFDYDTESEYVVVLLGDDGELYFVGYDELINDVVTKRGKEIKKFTILTETPVEEEGYTSEVPVVEE